MPEYEVIEFSRGFELDEDADVVAAQLSSGGTREGTNAHNHALVRRPDDGSTVAPSEGVDDEYLCGAETASGRCERAVSEPDANCWQHQP
jgi:hypothetical protein